MTSDRVLATFRDQFGFEATHLAVAPGRVNLIGEHTDYQDGFVFPAAIDRVTYVAAAITDGPTRLVSTSMGQASEFDISTVAPGHVDDWGKYVAAVGWSLRRFGNLPNIVAAVYSNVPAGSGVSSSAALELGFAVLYNEWGGLGRTNVQLAVDSQYAENEFVGNKCGVMDQLASACGKSGHAMFLDTRTLEIDYGPLPSGLTLVLMDTKRPRHADDWKIYRRRRVAGEQVARLVTEGRSNKLRDVSMEDLDFFSDLLIDTAYRRCRHVISENDRCRAFHAALTRGDDVALGPLMRASHEILRDDYEVTCPELDAMAEAAWAAPGVVGARMTGAGFGGACIALVQESMVGTFQDAVLHSYQDVTGVTPELHVCKAEDGARIMFH